LGFSEMEHNRFNEYKFITHLDLPVVACSLD